MKQESIKQSALCEQEIKGLSESEFQFYRKDIASNFGLNVTAIDKIRKAVTQEQQKSDNTLDIFVDYEPYDGYVSISETIRDIKACIDECMYIQPEYSLVVALWCVVTWFLSVLDIAPYLMISAPEKRCGKTQLLNLIEEFVFHPLMSSNLTTASFYYFADQPKAPTFLIDEADQFISRDYKELIGVFNAGYTRKSAYVLRVVGDKNKRPKKFSCFAFIAIAGISSKNLSETLLDRSIVIELKRKSTAITKIKPRDLDQNRLLDIKRKLTSIAIDYKDKLQKHKIQTKIDGLNDRQLDNWSPLLKLVELSNDKKFIEQTVAAVQKLSKEHDNNYTESNKHKILRFIAMAMKKQKPQQDLLSAEQLASFVNNSLDISVDASLTARRISMCLSEYNIKSKQTVQNDGRNLRCYSIQEISSVINDYIAETELMAEVL